MLLAGTLKTIVDHHIRSQKACLHLPKICCTGSAFIIPDRPPYVYLIHGRQTMMGKVLVVAPSAVSKGGVLLVTKRTLSLSVSRDIE